MSSLKREFIKNVIIGSLLSLFVIGILYYFINKTVIKEKLNQARLETTTVIYYRHYLSLVAPKVKILDKNLSPFAVTPAFVTNQVAKMLRKKGFYIKQVSDRYRDPLDKPIPIELKAIEYFKHHPNKDEYWLINPGDNYYHKKYIFYARKLVIEKSCLKCHGVPYKDVPANLYHKIVKIYGNRAFNYHLGEVRGIISIIIPYQHIITKVDNIFIVIVGVGIIFFIIGLIIFYKLNENINFDIKNILNNFRLTNNKTLPYLKEKMHFIEFEQLKDQINKTFKMLNIYRKELYKKYYLNPLTNLPNRNRFVEISSKRKYIIVLLNIDNFKEINFYFGTSIGDKLIKEVAKRLKSLSNEYKFKLFHIDIDEFGLLFKDISYDELEQILHKILFLLEKSYMIDGNEILIRFRCGVSYEFRDYLRANIALDMAKELKKDIVTGKEVINIDKYEEHLKWLKKLKWALENDRIVPFFQPIVDRDKNIIKYEALVRLIDENDNIVSPFFFLDIAKKSRLYLDITKIILEKSVQKIKEKNVAISINLTLEDIDNECMREFILRKIDEIDDKSKLTFEIVENEDVRESNLIKEFLDLIKKKGSLIYIDDFGSGYANFDYLIKLNPDGVKIDGSLIKNILTDRNSEIIVTTVVNFAKHLNIKTIAEFVENEEIFEKLKLLGIDYFQGYYFSPPKPTI